jgi:PAS domain S-box-containing protein
MMREMMRGPPHPALDDGLMHWRVRPDLSCDYASPALRQFTGGSSEKGLGDGVHPEDLPRWLDRCLRAFDAREPFEIEYRLRRWDGEYRWVVDVGVPRYGRDGAFLGYAGCCIDIDDFFDQRRSK